MRSQAELLEATHQGQRVVLGAWAEDGRLGWMVVMKLEGAGCGVLFGVCWGEKW